MTQPTSPAEIDGGAVRITKTAPPEQTRVVLFYIGDEAYSVPARIPANLGLQFLRLAAHRGTGVADIFLFEEMLGDTGMTALRDCDGMTPEQFRALRDKFDDLFVGQVDELVNGPKG
jgi:hypothetical protein